jgi:hypothetical protein
LFIDELPWLCRRILEADPDHGRQRIDQLFAAMRRWRNQGMVMLLIGSIGLVELWREHRLDMEHLNDLTSLSVPPFDTRAQATTFITALAIGSQTTGWTPAHSDALLDESAAWYPAMIQKAFLVLTIGPQAADLAQIPELFAAKVRPELDKSFFKQFDRRIKCYRGSQEAWAIDVPRICEAVLAAGQAITREQIRTRIEADSSDGHLDEADLGDALDMLQEDGFIDVRIDRDGGQLWRPASPLVSAWRRRRLGKH